MELKDLSSNWKKLQANLKNTSRTSKRKGSADILQPRETEVKRAKTDASFSRKFPESRTRGNQRLKEMDAKVSSSVSQTPDNASSIPPASLILWAEDNDIKSKDLVQAYGTSVKSASMLPVNTKPDTEEVNQGVSSATGVGRYIAIDCEMVGVGSDNESALARVSIVNYHGHQLYDSFVLQKEPVTDYRTSVSGITPQLLRSARTFETVQADVASLLDGRILIGHSVKNDLEALLLGHPKRDIRDTSRYPAFRQYAAGRTPGLKKLAKEVLGVDIQTGEHSSIEDARATMLLFRREKEGFESEHVKRWGYSLKKTKMDDASTKQKKRKGKK